MQSDQYKLSYLPLFYDDLEDAIEYIAFEKENMDAALRLLNAVDGAIMDRLPVAESFEQYPSLFERDYPYYRIYVDNFIVFYVVINDGSGCKTMEVRRFLYKGRDRDNIV